MRSSDDSERRLRESSKKFWKIRNRKSKQGKLSIMMRSILMMRVKKQKMLLNLKWNLKRRKLRKVSKIRKRKKKRKRNQRLKRRSNRLENEKHIKLIRMLTKRKERRRRKMKVMMISLNK